MELVVKSPSDALREYFPRHLTRQILYGLAHQARALFIDERISPILVECHEAVSDAAKNSCKPLLAFAQSTFQATLTDFATFDFQCAPPQKRREQNDNSQHH